MQPTSLCQRPYHLENTGSRSITAVKQGRARLVLGWETAWEHRVSLASFFFFASFYTFSLQKLDVFLFFFYTCIHQPKLLMKHVN